MASYGTEDEKLKEEDDLEALLDSAYEDLVKVESTKDIPVETKLNENKQTDNKTGPSSSQVPTFGEGNIDEFLSTMEAEFRRLMTANPDDPASLADIEKLTEELQKAAKEHQGSEKAAGQSLPDFASLLGGNAETFFANMASAQNGTASSVDDPSAGIMGTLLSQLLSHDLLYPAIAQLRERYPDWLENNKASPDFERCTKQFEVVKRLCLTYEQRIQSNDSNSGGNSQNLSEIVSLVQELQAFGDPPPELLEGDGADVLFPEENQNSNENANEECKVQ